MISDHLNYTHQSYCCGQGLNSLVAYELHRAKKHSTQDENGHLICHKCQKTFARIRPLLSHIRVDHFQCLPFQCDQCDKRFDLLQKLNLHVKVRHATEYNYQCDKCEKCYKTYSSLHTHIKATHSLETYHCDKCEYVGKTKKILQDHQVRQHSTGTWICEECGKVYNNPYSLRDHKTNNHKGLKEEDLTCTYEGCDSVFNSERGLKTHIKYVHLGKGKERNHECQFCHKKFKTPGMKIAHEKMIHLDIKDVTCDVCGYKTASKAQLRKHINRVHGTEEYKCDYPGCTKSYGVKGNMVAHKKRVHKVYSN